MVGTFELYRDAAGRYRFRLRTQRGKIVAVGEGFPTKTQAEAAIDQVRRLAPTAATEEAQLNEAEAKRPHQVRRQDRARP